MEWMVNATPRLPFPQERPGTLCILGWVDPRATLDGCRKSPSIGIRFPDVQPLASRYTDYVITAHKPSLDTELISDV